MKRFILLLYYMITETFVNTNEEKVLSSAYMLRLVSKSGRSNTRLDLGPACCALVISKDWERVKQGGLLKDVSGD